MLITIFIKNRNKFLQTINIIFFLEFLQNCKSVAIDLTPDFINIKNKIWEILQINNLPTVRQYIEIFALNTFEIFEEETLKKLIFYMNEKKLKPQFSISLQFVCIKIII